MENNTTKNFFKDPQNIIALAVSLISICALGVSIMQTRIMSEQRALMHEQAKASVWPRLQIERSKSHRREDYQLTMYELEIINAGVGPAIITDVRVSFDEKITKDWWDVFDHLNLPDTMNTAIGFGSINNSMVRIGEEMKFFSLSNNLPLAQYFHKNDGSIKIEIWYKSIYGDKWKLTYKKTDNKHEEVDSNFSLPDKEQFQN